MNIKCILLLISLVTFFAGCATDDNVEGRAESARDSDVSKRAGEEVVSAMESFGEVRLMDAHCQVVLTYLIPDKYLQKLVLDPLAEATDDHSKGRYIVIGSMYVKVEGKEKRVILYEPFVTVHGSPSILGC